MRIFYSRNLSCFIYIIGFMALSSLALSLLEGVISIRSPFLYDAPLGNEVYNSPASPFINASVHVASPDGPRVASSLRHDQGTNHTCKSNQYVECQGVYTPWLAPNGTFGISILNRPSVMKFPQVFDRKEALSVFDLTECLYSNCYFQDTDVSVHTSLVIIFLTNLNDNFKLEKRWPHQLYAAYTYETPYYLYPQLMQDPNSYWNSMFNLTISYRTDSDIFEAYGVLRFKPKPIEARPNYYDIAKTKTKSVLWFVSNCDPPSKRDIYVKQMQKIIDVDIFGSCGKPCPTNDRMCSPDIAAHYKFYLAFENAFCKDYVTEKFFKLYAKERFIVPVVRGGFDYDKYLPTDTFINAAHFKNATDLAHHLKELGDDPLAYSKYLERKDLYELRKGYNMGCQACIFLNTKKYERQIPDLKHWIEHGACHPPRDL
ncbi:alpha-(1,3)-fucosyltransferase C-like [Biomphalaria glabrata]|uniref:Fucosyltransferase n=1 Tax=Biomphalaria glabrata TaxID=6526 RepID=A0A9W3BPX5_BIOGL|nr:alpha-(1,3)-fucosyltransferase C-like [Biomphalaria glabrata]